MKVNNLVKREKITLNLISFWVNGFFYSTLHYMPAYTQHEPSTCNKFNIFFSIKTII